MDVYLVTALDPVAFVISQAAITVRRATGECVISPFASTPDGKFADQAIYVSGGGNDRISFWNSSSWSSFTCGAWTIGVKSMAWAGSIYGTPLNQRVKVYAGAGNDIVHAYENDLFILLEGGDDQFVVDYSPNRTPTGSVLGGPGNDIIHAGGISLPQHLYGGDGDDWFCGNASATFQDGEGGYDRSSVFTNPTSISIEEKIKPSACPPPPP